MLSSSTNTLCPSAVCSHTKIRTTQNLLRVYSPFQRSHVIRLAYSPQEDRFELVHTSIRKQKRRIIVGDHRARRDYISQSISRQILKAYEIE